MCIPAIRFSVPTAILWDTQFLHLCGHTNTVCSLSTLSHIKNPIDLRFWLHWSRWSSRQILTSRPKIYCYRASIGPFGSFCKALPFDFIIRKSAGILFLIQLSLAWTWHWALFWWCCWQTKRESHAWDDSSQTCLQDQVHSMQELGFTELAKSCAT